MICSRRSKSETLPKGEADAEGEIHAGGAEAAPYGPPFWLAYLGNTLVMTAVALLFRYADFVTLLGGSELHLGWIVGIGMLGSLVARLFLGMAIDRYGVRRVWLASLLLFVACCFGHLPVSSCHGFAIYGLRILFCCSLAGAFSASTTFVSGRAPMVRMAEMIGMLGTSGFIGYVLGTQLGDALCGSQSLARWQVDRMFLAAGLLAGAGWLFIWSATRGQAAPAPRRHPPMVWLLKRYHPGTVLLVGAAMGIGLGMPSTFLRTYAAELGIARIGVFFTVYSLAAIITRVLTRRLPERFGLAPLILGSMVLLLVNQLAFLLVRSEWMLALPGAGYGIAHAILFPTTVALGSGAFPNRYRGLGTTVMLACYDFGLLVGAPIAGWIVHASGALGLAGYPAMFLSLSTMLAVVAAAFAFSSWQARRRRPWSAAADHPPLECGDSSPLSPLECEDSSPLSPLGGQRPPATSPARAVRHPSGANRQ